LLELEPQVLKNVISGNLETFCSILQQQAVVVVSDQGKSIDTGSVMVQRVRTNSMKSNQMRDIPSQQRYKKPDFERTGISNQGNTCYLNATLQVLRNSLLLTESPHGEFAKLLVEFYAKRSRPNSIIDYLERILLVNLREQSDAASYLNTICKVLEVESSISILENIRVINTVVNWKCSICATGTTDDRGGKTIAYSIVIPEQTSKSTTLKNSVADSLKYTRDKNCKTCNGETKQYGTKTFDCKHLVLVPQSPKTMDIKPLLELTVHDLPYVLIGVVLHKGLFPSSFSNKNPMSSSFAGGGHYIAVVKDEDTWSVCNDSQVSKLSSSDVKQYFKNWTATILVYKPKK